ncbi:survival motor neuron (SMN) interacting protein 1 (SIP1) domain-containing protein [Ditylenchus destructor]|uniref:Gem-associated protein 2 n=1 Tax=Ditylenchus destructor TaxID=166010 RepID=A0AAD4NAS6_9BILA|nr:survival motor neuron (SMN) interacting protein 1 (SIP1) domain-containing protein [Ditylenchus destructor]
MKPFDRRKVDLNKMPATVDEYMQQVVVSRERCPDIVMADPESIPVFSKPMKQLVHIDPALSYTSQFTPGHEWNTEKSNLFSLYRSLVEAMNFDENTVKDFIYPSPNDYGRWRRIFFEQRPDGFHLPQQLERRFAHHTGTPPTVTLVKSFSDVQVNSLIPCVVEYVIDRGYSKAYFEWIFSLMLVVKKPLLHDVISSLRDFARKCRIWRSVLEEDQKELIYECSAMIAIISIYFNQKDLGDP